MAKNVFSGLVTACRLAGSPTMISPSSVKGTIDGVVRMPSAFSMTLGFFPSITATHELVVPRSIPITFAIYVLSFWQTVRALERHPASPPASGASVPKDFGKPADSCGGVPRLYRWQPYGPQGEGGE